MQEGITHVAKLKQLEDDQGMLMFIVPTMW